MVFRFISPIKSWAWQEMMPPGGLTRFSTRPRFREIPLCHCGEESPGTEPVWGGHSCPPPLLLKIVLQIACTSLNEGCPIFARSLRNGARQMSEQQETSPVCPRVSHRSMSVIGSGC
jgi:hypothetical protein